MSLVSFWCVTTLFQAAAGLLLTDKIDVDAPGEAVIAAIFYFIYSITVGTKSLTPGQTAHTIRLEDLPPFHMLKRQVPLGRMQVRLSDKAGEVEAARE